MRACANGFDGWEVFMNRIVLAIMICFFLAIPVTAGSKVEERLENAAIVLDEILTTPDNIPRNILDMSVCVVVFPSVKKLAIGLGGSYGRGAMVCRGGEKFRGPWGAPTMMALEGGSVGLQLGGQSTDFVLLVMYPGGADSLLDGKVKLGVDAAAAAGPKGGTVTVEPEAWMNAQILSYSRSRGLFGGISLRGSTLRPDNDANKDLYGKKTKAREVVRSGNVKPPDAAKGLVDCLEKASPGSFAL